MTVQAFVIYCSPAGTTRHVAQVIQHGLATLGNDVTTLDLSQTKDWSPVIQQLKHTIKPSVLFIGSPVYGGLPVPPVMEFIDSLRGGPPPHYAVPFVTWGLVSTGLALWHMASALVGQGFTLIGGLSVPALHSLHWQSARPIGEGRPSSEDDAQIAHMLDLLYPRIQTADAKPLPLDTFVYQEPEWAAELKTASFDDLRARVPPKSLQVAQCAQCDTCEENCPTGALVCDPVPQIDDALCILCYNCVRLCPEDAMQADLSDIVEGLPQWAADSSEPHVTRLFL